MRCGLGVPSCKFISRNSDTLQMSVAKDFGPHAELYDVRTRLRALQKRLWRARTQELNLDRKRKWRSSPDSPCCLVLLVYAGGNAEVAANFVQGQGWWRRKTAPVAALPAEDHTKLLANLESQYDNAPLAQIAAVQADPVKAGLCSESSAFNVIKWLVEHSLFDWVQKQNTLHGVAPSRRQLVDKALSAIPDLAPERLQRRVRSSLCGTLRSQRKWLAKFRVRWGLRLGKLRIHSRLSVKEKQAKEKGKKNEFVSGRVWRGRKRHRFFRR